MNDWVDLSMNIAGSSTESNVDMSLTPENLPNSTTTSAASDSTEDQGTKFEFTWQELAQVSRIISWEGWQRGHMPAALESVPENIVVSKPLRNILTWSLQCFEERILESATATAWLQEHSATETVDVIQKDTPAGLEANATEAATSNTDGSERSTTPSKTTSQRAVSLLSRLKQLRQDVAAKVASRGQRLSNASSAVFEVVDDVPQNGECISCFDEYPKADLVHLACSHDYCKSCAREVILTAMKTESAFPPKCCLTEIPLKTVLVCLDNKQRDEYRDKAAEYAIPAGHRWYCPEPECSKWVRPEKLHRERRSHQTCPHCKSKICSICRSLAHNADQDCPQDFGLESTLEVAESEGWRRCYSCRTMVELTIGCRHITCRCGAQFCYVCNARWKTCNCTEADKERRMAELRTRRQEREQQQQEEDAAAQAEAQEVADAIAQVEEMERQEAIRLAEEETRRQLEEELMLARLEEARLLEEIARREAEYEAERLFRRTLIESSKEECQAMMSTLMQIINYQHAALMSHHEAQEDTCVQEKESQEAEALKNTSTMASWLQENVSKRAGTLHTKQREEWEHLLRQAEEEEDDMFMHMHLYFRDKPHREQREKRMRDNLQKQQNEKQEALRMKHEEESRKLDLSTHYENEGLLRAQSIRLQLVEEQFQSSLRQLGWHIGCGRQWFQLVNTRRIEMLKAHKTLVLQQLEADQDPVGLSEEQARTIQPMLPSTDDKQPESPLLSSAERSEADQLAQSEPSQPPPVLTETADLYGTSNQDTQGRPSTPVQQASSSLTPHSLVTFDITSQLDGSSTVTQPISHAYPESTTKATSGPKGRRAHYLDAFGATPTKPKQAAAKAKAKTVNSAVSMSGMMAMPFMGLAQNGNGTASWSASTSPSTSLTSAATADTRRTSRTSATSADIDLLDTISASVVAGKGSGLVDARSGKLRAGKGILKSLVRKKEMSEAEIRRKMSGCVGDGFGT